MMVESGELEKGVMNYTRTFQCEQERCGWETV